ncbi:DUF3408 domain-containing protein [Chryseobacterium indologenes]|nr:DUF3408 domain-containing protein [Chryseobacterium indologenes]MBF6643933.1 DUF3408 domain-containing protein [Chryseobacterium indologenes]MBU3046799.1 DUF3408 domain-containing protein [Chryseobacterium indologenes]QQQ73279.1 DUF3408 domain-containing protein [Chryseobacterium indologenes]
MEDQSKRKPGGAINEDEMMNLMVDGVRRDGSLSRHSEDQTINDHTAKNQDGDRSASKISRARHKKSNEADYDKIFFKRPETNARDGKTVYIRPEFHEKLSRIIQVIGEDRISIYAYLDNLLEYHFIEFGEQITKSYNDKHKPIL